jgi:hypothetical protein
MSRGWSIGQQNERRFAPDERALSRVHFPSDLCVVVFYAVITCGFYSDMQLSLHSSCVTCLFTTPSLSCRVFTQVRTLKLAPDEPAYFVNSTVLASEIGNVLAERGREEGVRYAIVGSYNAKSHTWSMSLRSLFGRTDAPDASDVSRIAKLYGGA